MFASGIEPITIFLQAVNRPCKLLRSADMYSTCLLTASHIRCAAAVAVVVPLCKVMIAEAAYRRRGYAREAVAMLMRYGVESLGVSRYFCKIGEDNAGSLRLFETLGFERCNYAPAFREVELQFCPGKHPMPAAPMAVVDAPDLDTLTAEDNGQQSL
eukprot:TRINITY_DN1593_c0_g1_i1.p2 TRINITY_DN1593_c0_g1~~TRINITY_DN1593_c0_g1_i1.p2  ORF type:complete len:157 (-),score=33.65 TRINITY_DN1593_c0_g1_i1:22-492(-)